MMNKNAITGNWSRNLVICSAKLIEGIDSINLPLELVVQSEPLRSILANNWHLIAFPLSDIIHSFTPIESLNWDRYS